MHHGIKQFIVEGVSKAITDIDFAQSDNYPAFKTASTCLKTFP
jgi:hypothetical protein